MSSLAGHDEKPFTLSRFFGILRERWWVVVLTMLAVGVIAFAASQLFTPRYSATAQLAYSSEDALLASQALSSVGTSDESHNIANDALTLKTSGFANRVKEAMGTNLTYQELRAAISVTSDSELDVIEIKANSADAAEAADIANTFATEFVKQRQENNAAALTQAQKLLENRIASLTAEEAASNYGITLKQRYDDLSVLISMEIKDYKILQEAIVPEGPYFPRPYLNLELGLFIGLILGLVLAGLLDYYDRRIKEQSTLERLMDLPVIGTIPRVAKKRGKPAVNGNAAIGFSEGNEILLESMRMLRSNLKVLGFGESKRSILITSIGPAVGKSTLAVNLTLSMALSGERVVLVDADLRNPRIHQYLGIPNTTGLGPALADQGGQWTSMIQPVELDRYVAPRMSLARKSVGRDAAVSKFLCMTSGPAIADPSEIIESDAMTTLLDELQGISDYVILDGPPMLIASDSLSIAQRVDAVVLSSMLGKETAAEALQVRQLLARAEITALGLVICGTKPQLHDAYHHYYRPDHDGEVRVREGS